MTLNNFFTPKIDVELGVIVESDSITLSVSGTLSCVGGSLILNSQDFGEGPLSVNSGDVLAVRLQASSTYADQTSCVITLETIKDDETKTSTHVFVVVTKAGYFLNPALKDLEPFEIKEYLDGSKYNPYTKKAAKENKISVITEFNSSPVAVLKNLSQDALPSNVDSTDSLVFCSFFNKKLYRMSLDSNEINGIIDVPGSPYGAVAVPSIPEINYISNLWVTLSDKNKVVVINNYDEVIREFTVGKRPLGICTDSQLKNVWVANSYDNTVTRFEWSLNDMDWIQSSYPVGNKPFELACDPSDNVWITCAADNKVYKITKEGNISSYVVGANPRGIAYNSQKMWIAISQEQKIISLDLNGNIVNTIDNVGFLPFAVGGIPLPVLLKRNLSDIINITDSISANRIVDTFTLIEAILSNTISDNISFADGKLGSDRLADTLSFTDSLNIELTGGEQQEVEATDSNFRYVNLLITAEDPNPVPATRYLVIELLDYHAGVGGSINELVLLDANGNVIPYTVSSDGAYDLTTNDVPEYWNDHL